jgi:hypothetical protein
MTGPEHYLDAEDGISTASQLFSEGNSEDAQFAITRAQVHATLALAAATAEAFTPIDRSVQMWREVTR